jgi:hypothetical protein
MGLLPWTFGFLALISALSLYHFQTVVDTKTIHESIITKMHTDAVIFSTQVRRKAYQAHAKSHTKTEQLPHESDSTAQEETRSLTRLLHIPALFAKTDSPQKTAQERIFRNLVRILYGSQPIFEVDNEAEIQNLFTLVFKHAMEWEEKFPIKRASDLGNIPFGSDDPTGFYRNVFFRILKGGDGEFLHNQSCRIVSILDFVSTQKHDQCINAYLAPSPILLATFEKQEVVDEIIAYRDEVYRKLLEEEGTAATFEKEFREKFERYLPTEISPQYVDFRVSETYCAEEPIL